MRNNIIYIYIYILTTRAFSWKYLNNCSCSFKKSPMYFLQLFSRYYVVNFPHFYSTKILMDSTVLAGFYCVMLHTLNWT